MSRAFDGASAARVRDYVDLLKPRVMSLVVFTGVVGVMIAPGHLHPFTAALAVLAIALASGVLLSIFSVLLMAVSTNFTATALLAAAILFYVFIYTVWLKRRTPQNIVIGGAAGAFPPMIGWAAVTGDVSAISIALFGLIFLWTPPHFWALALYRSDDYRRRGDSRRCDRGRAPRS